MSFVFKMMDRPAASAAPCVKMMNFVFKTRNFLYHKREIVYQKRGILHFKMMNFVLKQDGVLTMADEIVDVARLEYVFLMLSASCIVHAGD